MPGEPRDVAAKPFNSSTVVVHWKPPADDKQNGVIRAYQIYIQPRNTVSQSVSQSASKVYLFIYFYLWNVQEGLHQYYSQPLRFNTGNPDVTSYNVTGLQPDTKYKIQVGNTIIMIMMITLF